jgi:hypothetical protein
VIGPLHDNSSYGVPGDHGGSQKSVQRIPLAFAGPGVDVAIQKTGRIRSGDITPTILRAMGIPKTDTRSGPRRRPVTGWMKSATLWGASTSDLG